MAARGEGRRERVERRLAAALGDVGDGQEEIGVGSGFNEMPEEGPNPDTRIMIPLL